MNYSTLYAADKTLLMVFNGSHCPFVDRLAVTLTCGYMWIPLYIALLLLVINNHKTVAQISLVIGMALLAIVLSEGMADLIVKPLVARLRPIHDTLMQDSVQVVNNYRAEGYSFFSAHASNTMAVAVFFSLLVKDRLFACTLITWALVNCWTRLYLGIDSLVCRLVTFLCLAVKIWRYRKLADGIQDFRKTYLVGIPIEVNPEVGASGDLCVLRVVAAD